MMKSMSPDPLLVREDASLRADEPLGVVVLPLCEPVVLPLRPLVLCPLWPPAREPLWSVVPPERVPLCPL